MNNRLRYPVRRSRRSDYAKMDRHILIDVSQLPQGLDLQKALEWFMEGSLNVSASDKPVFTVINGYSPRQLQLARMHCDEQPTHPFAR